MKPPQTSERALLVHCTHLTITFTCGSFPSCCHECANVYVETVASQFLLAGTMRPTLVPACHACASSEKTRLEWKTWKDPPQFLDLNPAKHLCYDLDCRMQAQAFRASPHQCSCVWIDKSSQPRFEIFWNVFQEEWRLEWGVQQAHTRVWGAGVPILRAI